MDPIQAMVETCLRAMFIPYAWSGTSPDVGFDCSGFVRELLKTVGINPGELNAQGLYDHFSVNGRVGVEASGSLAFYGKSFKTVDHVAFLINGFQIFEFGGGDHTTTTREEAMKRHAWGRIRPIKYRQDYLGSVKPDYSAMGYMP